MCGIAGILEFGRPPDASLANAMADVMHHRGPDESGHHADAWCALAMRRLAIVDVLHGHQPAYSEDGLVAVVFNGEIYNFAELRTRLEAKGHRMASAGDTEVIPHLYEEHGENFARHLRGMFAVAVWDPPRERLVLARDRLGKKPLFYTTHAGSLRFASEAKALFADRSLPREPDLAALHEYLSCGYILPPNTAFRGVRSLPPAQVLVADRSGIRTETYWSLGDVTQREIGREEAAAEVRGAVREAVRLRMVADVPLGAFLSGGVDSASVVASMAEASSRPVRTFTIGFDNEEHDERRLARQVATAFATDHTERVVTADVAGLLPLLVWHYDQPLADSSMLPSYIVAREARRDVTVALTGDGGDEAFAGYQRTQRIGRWATRRPRTRMAALARLPQRLDPMHPLSRGRRLALRVAGTLEDAYSAWTQLFPAPVLLRLYTPEMREVAASAPPGAFAAAALEGPGRDALFRLQAAEYRTYLPGDLLPKMDIASMAVSLEARSPLLDHQLVELAVSLPSGTKLGAHESKIALRDAFRGVVPDAVLDGPKRGFGVPVEEWFRGDLMPLARSLLDSDRSACRRILPREVIRHLLDAHHVGRQHHGSRIFALLVLELWFRTFIDEPPPLRPPADTRISDLT